MPPDDQESAGAPQSQQLWPLCECGAFNTVKRTGSWHRPPTHTNKPLNKPTAASERELSARVPAWRGVSNNGNPVAADGPWVALSAAALHTMTPGTAIPPGHKMQTPNLLLQYRKPKVDLNFPAQVKCQIFSGKSKT